MQNSIKNLKKSELLFMVHPKGRLRATIYESVATVHLILLCFFGGAIRWAVSAEKRWPLAIVPWFIQSLFGSSQLFCYPIRKIYVMQKLLKRVDKTHFKSWSDLYFKKLVPNN